MPSSMRCLVIVPVLGRPVEGQAQCVAGSEVAGRTRGGRPGAGDHQHAGVGVDQVPERVGPPGAALLGEDQGDGEDVGVTGDGQRAVVTGLHVDAELTSDRGAAVGSVGHLHEHVRVDVDVGVGEGAGHAEEDRAVGRGVGAGVEVEPGDAGRDVDGGAGDGPLHRAPSRPVARSHVGSAQDRNPGPPIRTPRVPPLVLSESAPAPTATE